MAPPPLPVNRSYVAAPTIDLKWTTNLEQQQTTTTITKTVRRAPLINHKVPFLASHRYCLPTTALLLQFWATLKISRTQDRHPQFYRIPRILWNQSPNFKSVLAPVSVVLWVTSDSLFYRGMVDNLQVFENTISYWSENWWFSVAVEYYEFPIISQTKHNGKWNCTSVSSTLLHHELTSHF